MHAHMKFRMRRRYCYECDVPHPLPLNGKYHMFCSREMDLIGAKKLSDTVRKHAHVNIQIFAKLSQ